MPRSAAMLVGHVAQGVPRARQLLVAPDAETLDVGAEHLGQRLVEQAEQVAEAGRHARVEQRLVERRVGQRRAGVVVAPGELGEHRLFVGVGGAEPLERAGGEGGAIGRAPPAVRSEERVVGRRLHRIGVELLAHARARAVEVHAHRLHVGLAVEELGQLADRRQVAADRSPCASRSAASAWRASLKPSS